MSGWRIGVIGGSGLDAIDALDNPRRITIDTPWGAPSDELLTGRIGAAELVFLPRHGRGHRLPPSDVNARANVDALKRAGCTDIVAISAVGSLREQLAPGQFVMVDQFIDRTSARAKSFFGPGMVAHVSMADPTMIGPTAVTMGGIVGQQIEIRAEGLGDQRPSAIAYNLASHVLKRFAGDDGTLPVHLFGQVRRVVREWLDGGYFEPKAVPKGVIDYLDIKDQAAERIFLACQRFEEGANRIKAILNPYNSKSSSRIVNFTTTKGVFDTAPKRSHVSHVVCDSDWEAELARVLEHHPRVIAYVKNHGLGFEVPYRDGSTPRRYIPDFIVRLDIGSGEPLNLVLETKGYRKGDAQLKAETMKTMWVPGVNNLGTIGTWAFEEFTDVFAIESDFAQLVDSLSVKGAA